MNTRFTRFLLFAFLIFPLFCFPQKEWNNWIFGVHAGISFNPGSPVPITTVSPLYYAQCANVTVSDSLGNLLFYAENNLNKSEYVYNRDNVRTPNGNLYNGNGQNNPQPLYVVKNLTDDSTYYIFSMIDPSPQTNPGGLVYSILDMRLDGGLGDIVPGQKSVPIISGRHTGSVLTGTRHHNNKDAWIVVHNHTNSNSYLSYLINSSGIDTTPIISPSLIHLVDSNTMLNTIKISPDGTKLICLADTNAEYCSFNSTTGVITHLFKIECNVAQGFLYDDAEFSVDNKYLYITEGGDGTAGSKLYQFDAMKTDSFEFKQSQILISSEPNLWNQFFTGLQRGPDYKIYCSTKSQIDSISVINNPSSQGTACNFQKNAVCLLPTNFVLWGLPQFLQKYKAYIHHNGNCQNNLVHIYGDIWPPPDSIHWDFGDPGSGPANVSNQPYTSHIYSSTGTYTVELFVKHIDHRTDTTWQTITILASPVVALGPDRTICTGDSTTFDAGPCSACTYVWKNIGSGLTVGTVQTFRTDQAGTYTAIVTYSNGCIGSDTVQLFTTPVPAVTNNPLSKSICSGESTNIPLAANVPGATFQWTASLISGTVTGYSPDSGLIINQVLVNSLPTPGVVTYHITPKVGSCIGTTVDFSVTVNAGDSVKVSITASDNNVCAGTLVTYTAAPTNEGTSPSYQWKINGINVPGSSSTYSYVPLNGDIVSCVLTSSNTVCISNNPATSNQVIMVIISNSVVGISIAASANPVCAGIPVNFMATPTNGGSSPTYQWKINGGNVGTSIPSYSYTPNNGDIVECILTSNILCPSGNPATSNTVTMTVNPNLPVSVLISASANPFCQGSSVTFTANPTNGGTTPSYQWKVNGIIVGPNNPVYTFSPLSGDLVSCILTSNIACPTGNPATSNSIIMIQNNLLPAGVSIVASTNPFCPGNSVTFTATPANGGINPSYQWIINGVNAGINSSTFVYPPVNGDSISCRMISNLACVSGNPAVSNKIIMSGTLASVVTFAACFDTMTTTNAQPIKLKGGIPLGGTYSGAGVTNGIFYPAIAGVGNLQITYTYTNAALCSASAHSFLHTFNPSNLPCGSPLTDIRDNKVYPTVLIGSQCWMASNLNYGTMITGNSSQRDNCIPEKYCYNDITGNCQLGTANYQWDELMQYDNTPSIQALCPPGWHVPTEADWNILFANYISNAFASSPLKYSGFSGFNALLSGARQLNKTWDFQGFATFFWSSTSHGATKAWAHGMNDTDPSVSAYTAFRSNAFSVRCVRD